MPNIEVKGLALDEKQVNELIVLPLEKESVALRTSTVLRPATGLTVEVPVIVSDYSTGTVADEAGVVSPGAEVPIASPADAKRITIEHAKLASRAEIPWEILNGQSFNSVELYGSSMVRRLVNTIDRAYFDETGALPLAGVGSVADEANHIEAALANVDAFLDAIEHAERHDTRVTSFCMSPKTLTNIAKLKRAKDSQEPLLGVSEAPGTSTIAGVPLVTSRHIADGVIWAIPQDRMIVSMRDDVQVKYDENANFNRMLAGIIAFARVGMACIEPAALTRIATTVA